MRYKIKNLRSEQGLTIRDLADKAKVSIGGLSGHENGKTEPGVDTAIRIAKALHSTVEEVFDVNSK